MTKKIIFLFATPVLEGDELKYSLNTLIEYGFQILIYDLTSYVAPDIERCVTKKRIHKDYIEYNIITTHNELINAIRDNCKDGFFFPMFDDYYQVKEVYRMFTKYDARFGYVNNLVYDLDVGSSGKLSNILKKLSIDKINSIIYNRVLRKVYRYKNAEFVAFGSILSRKQISERCRIDKNTTKIFTHTFDFQRFNDTLKYDNNGTQYCVFLDQYIPYHPDNIFDRGLKIDAKKYYNEICSLLDLVSKKFGLSIIIAAHPRADYSNKKVFPKSYKVISGKTSELIKGAKLVLAHFSTAIGFAVLAKVPLSILLPHAFSNITEFDNNCRTFADVLGCEIIEDSDDIKKIDLNFDYDKYVAFTEKYMTCILNNCETNLWDPVIKHI